MKYCIITEKGPLLYILSGLGGILLGGTFLLSLLALSYLFDRLRRWGSLPPETRAEEKRLKKHPFYPISKHARAAYLILCFEETLRAEGQNLTDWGWFRRECWRAAEEFDEDWAFRIYYLLPENILGKRCEDGETLEECWQNLLRWSPPYTAIEFENLYQLYCAAGSSLPQIVYVLDRLYALVDWDAGESNSHAPEALCYIDQAEQFMREHNIPRPQDETALNFLRKQRDIYGNPPISPLSKL